MVVVGSRVTGQGGEPLNRALEILVVEDNPQNLELVEFLLEDAGFTVRSAGNADETREQLDKALPSMILMDIQLPEISGLEITKQIKSDDELKNIPVIAVTAFAMKGDEEKIREGGCEGYIAKPISVANFLKTIEEFV